MVIFAEGEILLALAAAVAHAATPPMISIFSIFIFSLLLIYLNILFINSFEIC
jgi:hypothetical protein